jgi:hypothetical protein
VCKSEDFSCIQAHTPRPSHTPYPPPYPSIPPPTIPPHHTPHHTPIPHTIPPTIPPQGVMPLPSWGASSGGQHSTGGGTVGGGTPMGVTFEPPSCDAVLRNHYWFWQPHTESSTKSTHQLVSNYLTSVGRAANLILNIAPDNTGEKTHLTPHTSYTTHVLHRRCCPRPRCLAVQGNGSSNCVPLLQ